MKSKIITIGSDPELSFAFGRPLRGNFHSADNFLTDSQTSQLGCDGCSDIAEIRPKYSDNPLDHIDNLRRILSRLNNKVNEESKENDRKLNVYAGNGFSYATGGHIHFGISINKNKDILKLLDMMAIFLVPFEKKEYAVKRRVSNGYGQLGAYEVKSYGFEYRTLASWLYSENNARSILCLAYTLAYEFMNNREFAEKIIKTFYSRVYNLHLEKEAEKRGIIL